MTNATDDQIADRLRTGATYAAITKELRVGQARILRIRLQRDIALPPSRARRTRTEMDALERDVTAMLRAGDRVIDIRRATGSSYGTLARLRRELRLTPAKTDLKGHRVTADDAFDFYAVPSGDGHLLWDGPRSGRSLDLLAGGRSYNARAIVFRKHHGRTHEGRLRRTCGHLSCIAGAHHTDHRICNQGATHAH